MGLMIMLLAMTWAEEEGVLNLRREEKLQQKMLQQLPWETTLGLSSSQDIHLLWAVLLAILFTLNLCLFCLLVLLQACS
jgi:hypothetical protein